MRKSSKHIFWVAISYNFLKNSKFQKLHFPFKIGGFDDNLELRNSITKLETKIYLETSPELRYKLGTIAFKLET